MTATAIRDWPDRLERRLETGCTLLRRARVLAETDSTQDAALRLRLGHGECIVAARQTAGRGQRGRPWLDQGDDGIALTVVTEGIWPVGLSVVHAVGVARGLETLLDEPVAIKWPNDLLLGGRKLGGILVERIDRLDRAGIGINVGQTRWPASLAGRAISLREVGHRITRIEVLEAMLPAIDRALTSDPDEIDEAYRRRDVLAGRTGVFLMDGRIEIAGRIRSVRPLLGLEIEDVATGERWMLPAATTSIKSLGPDSDKRDGAPRGADARS